MSTLVACVVEHVRDIGKIEPDQSDGIGTAAIDDVRGPMTDAENENVGAGTTDQDVVTFPAVQPVLAAVASDDVVADVADQPVVAATAGQRVGARLPEQRIAPAGAEEPVVTRSAL